MLVVLEVEHLEVDVQVEAHSVIGIDEVDEPLEIDVGEIMLEVMVVLENVDIDEDEVDIDKGVVDEFDLMVEDVDLDVILLLVMQLIVEVDEVDGEVFELRE